MEHQDNNLFEQFKKAAENQETKDFQGLEKVWSRVDAKLDTQIYKQQKNINSGWKKFAVAASVVVGSVFAYQILKEEKTALPMENKVIVQETAAPQTEPDTISFQNTAIIIPKKEAKKILEKQIQLQTQVAVKAPETSLIINDSFVFHKPATIIAEEEEKKSSEILKGKVHNAIGVKHTKPEEVVVTKPQSVGKKQTFKKAPPLIIVDGKVVKNDSDTSDAETVLELEEPLYIVNNIEYTEKEMFGPNPTSPYFPLNKQEIESIVVYEGKEAIEKFGQKGSKGVVVVKTKDGKPAVLKK